MSMQQARKALREDWHGMDRDMGEHEDTGRRFLSEEVYDAAKAVLDLTEMIETARRFIERDWADPDTWTPNTGSPEYLAYERWLNRRGANAAYLTAAVATLAEANAKLSFLKTRKDVLRQDEDLAEPDWDAGFDTADDYFDDILSEDREEPGEDDYFAYDEWESHAEDGDPADESGDLDG